MFESTYTKIKLIDFLVFKKIKKKKKKSNHVEWMLEISNASYIFKKRNDPAYVILLNFFDHFLISGYVPLPSSSEKENADNTFSSVSSLFK